MAGYSGSNYDRHVARPDRSTGQKLRSAYWTTKQAVRQKFGRPEDQHLIASDAELDAKLELYRSVHLSFTELQRCIRNYDQSLCGLSQAENELGRFLKSRSSDSRGSAGKMMTAVGKSLSFSAQQRLALRVPLDRLQQEVDTFQRRAVTDTSSTVQRMETARTDYRGSLLWMKKVSEELDPDAYKQLNKFRSVQEQVRCRKAAFDQVKLDTMQKVDLLAASRCNMLSHALVLYQDTLLQFWAKTSQTMEAVADSFRGYQFYEFNMLKDLVIESRKLANQTTAAADGDEDDDDANDLIREEDSTVTAAAAADINCPIEDLLGLLSDSEQQQQHVWSQHQEQQQNEQNLSKKLAKLDEIFEQQEFNEHLLPAKSERLSSPEATIDTGANRNSNDTGNEPDDDEFLRDLLDLSLGEAADVVADSKAAADEEINSLLPAALQWPSMAQAAASSSNPAPANHSAPSVSPAAPANQASSSSRQKPSSAADWLSMFAELDPLANPDAVGKQLGQKSGAL